jgi:hypothetical protein
MQSWLEGEAPAEPQFVGRFYREASQMRSDEKQRRKIIKRTILLISVVLMTAATAQAATLPGSLPASMPILTSTNGETFAGNAVLPASGATVRVGAFEYFLVGGGGGGWCDGCNNAWKRIGN